MSEPIEIDDQETGYGGVGNQPKDEGDNPRTSSEPEHHSGSEESKNSTRSLSGSLLEQHFENGRRYCSQTYYMPNDDEEQTRLAIAHQAYLPILDGQLTLAHIPESAERILDIGTGTGDWAIAVAERFPNAEIIATDITIAFQPATAPPNVFFELDDAQEEWTYNEPFDFIHMRDMSGAFSDWDRIYAEVAKHLRPGGSFEIVDNGAIRLKEGSPDSYVSIYNGVVQLASEKSGRPLGLDHLKKQVLGKAGLSVVKSKVFEVPLGPWPDDPQRKAAGKMAMVAALEGLEAASLRPLTKHMGWKEEEVRDLCEKMKLEILNGRAYWPCQFIVTRKLMI